MPATRNSKADSMATRRDRDVSRLPLVPAWEPWSPPGQAPARAKRVAAKAARASSSRWSAKGAMLAGNLALPLGPGAGQQFGRIFDHSPQQGLRLATQVASSAVPAARGLAGTRDLVHWASASGQPAHRLALAKAFKQAKSQMLFIHHIGELPADQAEQMMRDYFEAGGELSAVAEWLAAAGALERGAKARTAPARGKKAAAKRGARAARFGLGGIGDWIGDKVGSIADMAGSIVNAVVKAGKSLASVIGSVVNYTVAQLTDVAKALKKAGRAVSELLSAAVSKSLAFMQKMMQAALAAGYELRLAVYWVTTQALVIGRSAVLTLLAMGKNVSVLIKTALSLGEAGLQAGLRCVLAAGQTLRAVLSAISSEALLVVQVVVRALRVIGQGVRALLAEAVRFAPVPLQRVLQALLSVGVSLGNLIGELAALPAAAITSGVRALLALGQQAGTLLAAVAAAGLSAMRSIVTALLTLGQRLADLVLAGIALGVGVARSLFGALLAMGHKVSQILVTVAGRAVSALRTSVEALLAMGVALADIVAGIVLNVAEGFRRGFFEGLLALGKAPLELMRAATLGGAAVALLACTVLLELLGGHRSLTAEERAEAEKIFGRAINLDRVKVAVASLPADLINYLNGERPFTSMYIINFANSVEIEMHVLIHELTHVWQGVQEGPLYMTRALEAQVSAGLSSLFHSGEYNDEAAYAVTEEQLVTFAGDFSRFNPEQQASIVEFYWIKQFSDSPGSAPHSVELLEPYAKQVFTPVARGNARRRPASGKQRLGAKARAAA